MANKCKMNLSEYIRHLILYENESALNEIMVQLKLMEQNHNILKEIRLEEKRIYKHEVLVSTSILQIKYLINKLISMFMTIYGSGLPSSYHFATNKEKDEFVKNELEKIKKEMEEVIN